MKIRVFLKSLVIAALLAAYPALAVATTTWPGVSFSFDDGYQSLNIARPLFKQYNVVGVSFPIVGYIGTSGMATWDDLSALLADGWEIGSHTMNHHHLSTLSDSQLDYELGMSKQILESTLNTPIYALALPFGDGADNPRVLSSAAKYYHFVRNVQWDYNSLPPSPYHLVVQEPYSFTTTSTIIQWIETARSQGKWLILAFHNVVNGTPDLYVMSIDE